MSSNLTHALSTQLLHAPTADANAFDSLAVPVFKGSSLFFPNTAAQRAPADLMGLDYSYGLHGNPTQYTLAQRLAHIEGARFCSVVPSGLTAIVVVAHAVLKTGDHWLIPGNVYNPVQVLAKHMHLDYGIEFDEYDPMDLEGMERLVRPNTRMIWAEAPGSITFEVPDLGKLVEVAHKHQALTAIDNTWSAGIAFKPFEHGFDFSIQALTKYQNGHADVLMGAVLTSDDTLFEKVILRRKLLGVGVSPMDCDLVLRGLHTLPLRYAAQGEAGLHIAAWLRTQPEVQGVLHPAFPECPGHANYVKYFQGAASVFSVLLKAEFGDSQACKFVDNLDLFRIAYSWGGPESLALAGDLPPGRLKKVAAEAGSLVRLAIGLEAVEDLKRDLRQALDRLHAA